MSAAGGWNPAPFTPGQPLSWTRAGWFQWEWTLASDGREIARMTTRTWYGVDLRIEAASGNWMVRRRWSGAVEMRHGAAPEWPKDDAQPVARFVPGLFGRGTIRIGADAFSWRTRLNGFDPRATRILNASEFPALEIERRSWLFRPTGTMAVTDTGRRYPGLETLVLMSWALCEMATRHGTY